MLRRLRNLLALGFLIASPALAAIITDVTVNGSVSGTGNMTLVCYFVGGPPPGCYEVVPGRFIQIVSTSFSATNTQLGDFVDSSQATGFGPTDLGIFASQSTTATADSLSLDLFTGFSIRSGTRINGYNVSLQNSIVVGFDLTTESLLQLSAPGLTQIFDSNGSPVFTVPECCGGSTILGPGMYEFSESLPMTADSSLPLCYPRCGTFLGFQLDAKFTPIPEPRWAGLTLLIGMGCLAFGSGESQKKRFKICSRNGNGWYR